MYTQVPVSTILNKAQDGLNQEQGREMPYNPPFTDSIRQSVNLYVGLGYSHFSDLKPYQQAQLAADYAQALGKDAYEFFVESEDLQANLQKIIYHLRVNTCDSAEAVAKAMKKSMLAFVKNDLESLFEETCNEYEIEVFKSHGLNQVRDHQTGELEWRKVS